ncbi:hypothetical protein D3C84_1057700 [compost metagenome]
MSANARARLMKIDSWMIVCHCNDVKRINVKIVTYFYQLIGECYIDIPIRILHQFGHFCSLCICPDDISLYEK